MVSKGTELKLNVDYFFCPFQIIDVKLKSEEEKNMINVEQNEQAVIECRKQKKIKNTGDEGEHTKGLKKILK